MAAITSAPAGVLIAAASAFSPRASRLLPWILVRPNAAPCSCARRPVFARERGGSRLRDPVMPVQRRSPADIGRLSVLVRTLANGGERWCAVLESVGRGQPRQCPASGAETGQTRWPQAALNGCDNAYPFTRNSCYIGISASSRTGRHCCGPGCRRFESGRHEDAQACPHWPVSGFTSSEGCCDPTAGRWSAQPSLCLFGRRLRLACTGQGDAVGPFGAGELSISTSAGPSWPSASSPQRARLLRVVRRRGPRAQDSARGLVAA